MDRKLTAADAAKRVGVKVPTWWAYVYRERAPQPDGREELSGKPWWWESTIEAYATTRPGTPGRPRSRAS